jgi:hypothetical protein
VHTGLLYGNLRERDDLEDPGVDGRIILRWFFSKWEGGGHGMDRAGLGYGQLAGSCKRGNEPIGGACSTYGGQERCIQGFCMET